VKHPASVLNEVPGLAGFPDRPVLRFARSWADIGHAHIGWLAWSHLWEMEDRVSDRIGGAEQRPKDTYTAPSVTVLGRIEDLTASGIGGIMEHGQGAGATFSVA
jgi:hypothetical protein